MPSESSSVVSNETNGIEPPRDYLSIKKSKKGPLKQIVPSYQMLQNFYTLSDVVNDPMHFPDLKTNLLGGAVPGTPGKARMRAKRPKRALEDLGEYPPALLGPCWASFPLSWLPLEPLALPQASLS